MTININQIDSNQKLTENASGAEKPGAKQQADDDTSGPDLSAPGESLTVTYEATKLIQLDQELSRISPIDSQKVDSIRLQLEAGTYNIDSNAIARNLATSEQELF